MESNPSNIIPGGVAPIDLSLESDFTPEEPRFDEDADLQADEVEPTQVADVPLVSEDSLDETDQDIITEQDTQDVVNGKYDPYYEEQSKPLFAGLAGGEVEDPSWMPSIENKETAETVNAYIGAAGQGILEAGENIVESVGTLTDAAVGLAYDMEDPDYFANAAKEFQIQSPEEEAAGRELINYSTGTQLVSTVSQFVIPFGGIMRGVKVFQSSGKVMPWMKKLIGAGVAGAATDFLVWDYTDKRLADFADSYGSEVLSNAQREFNENPEEAGALNKLKRVWGETLTHHWIKSLKLDDDDSPLMARTKQGIEGFLFGKILDPIIGMMGAYGKAKAIRARDGAPQEAVSKLDNIELSSKPVEVGSTVKALDQNNFGKVVSMSDGKAKVRFENKANGTKAVVELPMEQLRNVATVKQTAGEIGDTTVKKLDSNQDIVLKPEKQKAFTKAYHTKNIDQGAAILADDLTEMVGEVVDNKTLIKFDDAVDELLENSRQASKKDKTWAKRAQAASKDLPNDATILEEADTVLKTGQAKANDLDLDILKQKVVNRALGRQNIKMYAKHAEGKISDEQLLNHLNFSAHAEDVIQQTGSDAGRALKMLQNESQELTATQVRKMAAKMEKDGSSLRELSRRLGAINPDGPIPEDLTKIIRKRQFVKAGAEAFVNSVLSPTSLGVNLTSNTIMMMARTADIHAAAFRSGTLDSGAKAVTHKQAFAHTVGYLAAIPDALSVMWRSYKADKALFSNSRLYVNEFTPKPAITADNLGYRGENLNGVQSGINSAINGAGKLLRGVPGSVRSMMATDEFFKVLNSRAYLYSDAIKQAESVNLLTNPKEFTQLFKKNLKDSVEATKYNKNQSPEKLAAWKKHQASLEESHMATFTSDFTHGEKIYKFMRSYPMVSFILPFVRQPVNNMLYLLKTTPGLNLVGDIGSLTNQLSRDIAAGGAKAEKAMAHMSVASAVWAYAAMTAFSEEGNIQGNPKGETTEGRDIGIDPNTIRTDDGDYVNYRGGEPVAGRWAIMSGLMHQWMNLINEAGDQLSDQQVEDLALTMVGAGALTVLDNFKDQSSLRGMERMLQLFEGGQEERVKNVLTSFVTGWTSVLSGQIKYIREQYLGEEHVKYAAETLPQHFDNRYGGALSAAGIVEPPVQKLNSFGDVMPGAHPLTIAQVLGNDSKLNPANYLPTNIRKTKGFTEPYQQEIQKIRRALPGEPVLGVVPQRIGRVKIDNRERHNLLLMLKHLDNGEGDLKTMMLREMNKPQYQHPSTTDEHRATMINKVYAARMKAAQTLLLVDANAAHNNLPRPYAKKLGLVEYRRSASLAVEYERFKAIKNNRLVGKASSEYIDIPSYNTEISQEYSNEADELKAYFQKFN